jgi:hypothetical protein
MVRDALVQRFDGNRMVTEDSRDCGKNARLIFHNQGDLKSALDFGQWDAG